MPKSKYSPVFEDIEDEAGNDDVSIKIPFDPTSIKIHSESASIGQILDDVKDKVLNLDTEFQRMPGLWDLKKKSRFIESLLLRLPIPAFYFYEKEENDLEIVDGLQRISALTEFVLDKTLVLDNLEFLKEYNTYNYDRLPGALQRRIVKFGITYYLIEKQTPSTVKYNIFKRINQGGLILTPQEIRHAINQGKSAELVADLVRWQEMRLQDGSLKKRRNSDGSLTELKPTPEGLLFAQATDRKIKIDRMEDRDFAARFLTFYLIDYTEYQPDLDTFLNTGMAKAQALSITEIQKIKKDFARSMTSAFEIFGNDAFRKRFDKSDDRKPINKALFEVLSVTFAKLSQKDSDLLVERKQLFKKKFIELHRDNSRFVSSITQGTAQKESVDQRFTDINKIVKDTLK